MGASCWVYYVPYQENCEQAFQKLRQDLFETDEDIQAQKEGDIPPPQTIRELLERSEGSGTHTAVDIEGWSAHPRDYSILSLSAESLHRVFVETTPTRILVEEMVDFAEKHIFPVPFRYVSPANWRSFFSRYYDLCAEETIQFAEREPSRQEVIETLLTRERIWKDFCRILRLDFGVLVNTSRMGEIMPFSAEELVSFFGTEKPTRATFELVLDELWFQLPSWTGFYITLYQDGAPHEIAFVGISGD